MQLSFDIDLRTSRKLTAAPKEPGAAIRDLQVAAVASRPPAPAKPRGRHPIDLLKENTVRPRAPRQEETTKSARTAIWLPEQDSNLRPFD